MGAADVLERALKLSEAERAELAYQLLDSLEAEGLAPRWWESWREEVERRAQAYESGEVEAEDLPSALAGIRKSLHPSSDA